MAQFQRESSSNESAQGTAQAVDIYGGELLEGRYDEWLLDERERRGTDWAYAGR